jgi:FtsP/CotA-like multicopper oxidase with cupredoxin domain
MTPNPNPDTTEVIELDLATNATGHHVWIQNGQTFRADYNSPLLLLANEKNYTFDPEWSVYNFGSNKTIRIVINNKYQSAHPMHMHGHNMVSSPSQKSSFPP